MPVIETEDEGGSPIPEARYFDHAPEFDVGSWSPTPAGQVHPREAPTQVHLRFGTPPGPCSIVRLKSARIIDLLIDALIKHREYVWGRRSVDAATLDQARNAALEEAAALHESINPASDEERHHRAPGAGAMGAVIEYRDKIRELKGKRPAGSVPPVISSKGPR